MLLNNLLTHENRINKQQAFSKWKEVNTKEFYNTKLKNAAQMVDKISRFSRSFISLNSLGSII